MSGVDLERVYRAAPVCVQNLLTSVEGWRILRRRYGPSYQHIEREVFQRQSLSGAELVTYQGRRLTGHLLAAAASRYWQRRFEQYSVHPNGSDPFAELAKLPILSKREVQDHAAEIQNPTYSSSSLRCVHTSGTTGAGLVFWETAEAESERWAVWWRYRHMFGLNRQIWSGHFGGRSVVPIQQSRPPFWRSNNPGRQLLMSAYHLSERTIADYWAALRKWNVKWLHGYPSFLSLLAELGGSAGLPRLDAVRWITTGAENLLDGQRRQIEAVFGVAVRQHYGQTESVANISEDKAGNLRVDEDFSHVEFVADGNCGAHRIVGTNWSNPAFPLLRYDTGDLAQVATTANTGGWRKVQEVDGRREDFVVLPTGARVGRLDHVFKDLTHIREAQIYQPSPDRLVFRVVKGPGYDSAAEETRLVAEARTRLGNAIALDVQYMDAIPRTRSGKLRFVVSDLAPTATESPIRKPAVSP